MSAIQIQSAEAALAIARGDRAMFLAVLDTAPDIPPVPGDELV